MAIFVLVKSPDALVVACTDQGGFPGSRERAPGAGAVPTGRSPVRLFECVAPGPSVADCPEKYFAGDRDASTIELLAG